MRLHNWDLSLAQFLKDSAEKEFAWGTWDCCRFVNEAIKCVSGIDYFTHVKGRYTTEIGAQRLIKRIAGKGLYEAFRTLLNEPKPLLLANRGDIAVVHQNGYEIAVVIFNGYWAVTENGLENIIPDTVLGVWGID